MRSLCVAWICLCVLSACGARGSGPDGAEDAFDGPMTGGRCDYETDTLTGYFAGSDAAQIYFRDEGNALFGVPASQFPGLAESPSGASATFERKRIISGTCTPEIFELLEFHVP